MSWPEFRPPAPAQPAAVPLRDVILGALEDAIVYRTADFAFCHDCERAIDGLCERHRDDSAMVDDYEAIRAEVAGADKLVLALGHREPPW